MIEELEAKNKRLKEEYIELSNLVKKSYKYLEFYEDEKNKLIEEQNEYIDFINELSIRYRYLEEQVNELTYELKKLTVKVKIKKFILHIMNKKFK